MTSHFRRPHTITSAFRRAEARARSAPAASAPVDWTTTHAADCRCGACGPEVPLPGGFEKRGIVHALRPGKPSPLPQVGDHVWVRSGEYRGCRFTLLRDEGGMGDVCARSSPPFEIRTRRISLYRRITTTPWDVLAAFRVYLQRRIEHDHRVGDVQNAARWRNLLARLPEVPAEEDRS